MLNAPGRPLSGTRRPATSIETPRDIVLSRRIQRFAGTVRSRSPLPPLRFVLNGRDRAASCRHAPDDEAGFSVRWDFVEDLARVCEPDGVVSLEIFAGDALCDRRVFQRAAPDDRGGAPLVLLQHIPKTAGTSLRVALERHPEIRLLALYHDPGFMTPSECDGLGEDAFDDLDVVFGHFYHGLHRHTRRPCRYMTVLRHPAELVKSYYLFMKYTTGSYAGHATIEDAISAPGHHPAFDNVMTRYVAGQSPGGPIDEAVFAQAMRNLETYAYVGFAETMADSLARIGARLGVALDEVTANVTPRSAEAEGLDRDALSERFASHLRFDLRLYERARDLFPGGPRVSAG